MCVRARVSVHGYAWHAHARECACVRVHTNVRELEGIAAAAEGISTPLPYAPPIPYPPTYSPPYNPSHYHTPQNTCLGNEIWSEG